MRRALVLAAVTALAVAKPEMYREKEDFQYSRSSSDDGTKSGFYGAQRGNMGGNYERAHNMDGLAQHQMGGLVRTVEGELGDGAKQKSGSVFTAANSRGVYGSGHYDLSHLEGRNFQEGESVDSSQTQSSSHSAGYGSQAYLAANSAHGSHSYNSRNSGYNTAGISDQALYTSNLQSSDNLQSASQYDGTQTGHSYGYRSGYQGQSGYDQAASNSHLSTAYGPSVRLVSGQPVRVFVRPGSRVTIPVAAQVDSSSHGATSTFDQNAINSEAEVLGSDDQQTGYNNQPKRYESSYSYRKEWEKHNTLPVTGATLAVPTVNPYPTNSELYEDTQAKGSEHQYDASAQEAQNIHSSSQYRRYNVKSASGSQSRDQSAYNYNGQQSSAASNSGAASNLADSSVYTHGTYNQGASASDSADSSVYTYGARNHGSSASNVADSSAHNHGASAYVNSANLNNQVDDFGSKPRSYQSSYRYQKSWERQGDPYVIRPATNGVYTTADGQASQRLTASSLNQGASSTGAHEYGSHHHQGYSSHNGIDCDEHGHIRVARSYKSQDLGQQSQNVEDFSQQSQNLENFGQQSQNLEDFSQQSQNLENFNQQSQNLEDFSQQSQNLGNLGQQSQNLEDLGQQSQNLENFGQQPQNLDFGQQSQDLHDFGQQSQHLEDLSQQSQNLENFGQQSQNLEDLGQETQNLNQQSQKLEDFGQVQDAGQQTQSKWDNMEQGQQAQNQIDRIVDLSQQTQTQWDQQSQTDLGQQTQNTWSTLDSMQYGNSGKDTHGGEHTGYTHHGANTAFPSQEGVFEIGPSNVGLDKVYNNQQNPFAHVVFNEQHQEHEQTGLGKTDFENQFTQSDNMGQQTHNFWDAFQTNMNHNNPNVFVPIMPIDPDRVRQDSPYWQTHQINFYPNNGNNQQTYFTDNSGYTNHRITPGYNNPNVESKPYGYRPSVNTYSNSEIHYSDHSTHSLSDGQINPHESGSTSISNLWSLLDNIEKQTISGASSDSNHSYSQENRENIQTNSSYDWMHNFNENSSNTESKPVVPITFLPSTTEHLLIKTTTDKQDKLITHDVERGDIGPEINLRPSEDVGRGDIGPDESIQNKPLEIVERKPVQTTSKPFKTPEEIETLSLTKEHNKTAFVSAHSTNDNFENTVQNNEHSESDFSVLSLSDQKQLVHHSEEDNWKLQSDNQKTTSTTPKSFHIEHIPRDLEQQHTNQFENSGQQVENLNPQSYNQFEGFDQKNDNLDQHNMDHQMVDFGQQSEHLGQEHVEDQLNNFNQQNINLDQQDKGHSFIMEQGPDEIQQQNTDQQFETSEQLQNNENQQSFNQFEELGQQTENFGQEHQQLENFGQQSEGFHQENLNDFAQHEQFQQEFIPEFRQNGNLNQPQKEQQLENWGQQNENLEQQSQTEDLSQQVQFVSKPSEDLLQPTDQVETFDPTSNFHKEGREPQHSIPIEPVVEQEIVTQKITNVDAPPETVTEKVGFWNKVGSKFSTAKEKVSSWFKRS